MDAKPINNSCPKEEVSQQDQFLQLFQENSQLLKDKFTLMARDDELRKSVINMLLSFRSQFDIMSAVINSYIKIDPYLAILADNYNKHATNFRELSTLSINQLLDCQHPKSTPDEIRRISDAVNASVYAVEGAATAWKKHARGLASISTTAAFFFAAPSDADANEPSATLASVTAPDIGDNPSSNSIDPSIGIAIAANVCAHAEQYASDMLKNTNDVVDTLDDLDGFKINKINIGNTNSVSSIRIDLDKGSNNNNRTLQHGGLSSTNTRTHKFSIKHGKVIGKLRLPVPIR